MNPSKKVIKNQNDLSLVLCTLKRVRRRLKRQIGDRDLGFGVDAMLLGSLERAERQLIVARIACANLVEGGQERR